MKIAKSATFIVMGVCGVGKTTVAQLASGRAAGSFLDADDFHSEENVRTMREGKPLTDAMRLPWLHSVAAGINAVHHAQPDRRVFAACPALKRSYRDMLREQVPGAVFVYLSANERDIRKRLSERSNHFMPVQMLEGQLAVLEPPTGDEPHIKIDATVNIEATVAAVINQIERFDAFA